MDKTRLNDIYKFLQRKGYEVERCVGFLPNGDGVVLEVTNWANEMMAICTVTETQFVMLTDGYVIKVADKLDFSDEWIDFELKEHPEQAPNMIKELNERIATHNVERDKQLAELKAEYQRALTETNKEGSKLQTMKKKITQTILRTATTQPATDGDAEEKLQARRKLMSKLYPRKQTSTDGEADENGI